MDIPGNVSAQTIVSTAWQARLSGLINLDSSAAKSAQLSDRDEPINVYAHVLQHPKFGTYLIDTGVSKKVLDNPSQFGVNWLVQRFMSIDKIAIKQSTSDLLANLNSPLQGVFLTHMHLDHIAGMPDIDSAIPVYIGKNEATTKSLMNVVVQSVSDGVLGKNRVLREWNFSNIASATMSDGLDVLDVFGDGTVFAISVPGHTPGSTAYLVRTAAGAILFTGDTSHTQWGWDNGVEPGSFTEDHPRNLSSLLALKELSKRHPKMTVRFGHQ